MERGLRGGGWREAVWTGRPPSREIKILTKNYALHSKSSGNVIFPYKSENKEQ